MDFSWQLAMSVNLRVWHLNLQIIKPPKLCYDAAFDIKKKMNNKDMILQQLTRRKQEKPSLQKVQEKPS